MARIAMAEIVLDQPQVAPGAVVRESVLLTDAIIEEGALVERAIIDKKARVQRAAHVGSMEAQQPLMVYIHR